MPPRRLPVSLTSRPIRAPRARQHCQAAVRMHVLDGASARRHCGGRCTTRYVVCRAVWIGLVGDIACRARIPENDLPVSFKSLYRFRLGVEVALAVRDWDPQSLSPMTSQVNGVSVCSTLTNTCSHWNLTLRLRSIAPGRSPASSSTWNPLQMPSTGPPASAKVRKLAHDRENRAIAPVRR